MSQDTIYIVIPIYNEAQIIGEVITNIKKQGYAHIIVVDDGSTDNPHKIVKKHGAIYIRHSLNRGKGAAVKTGIEAAKLYGAGIVVTIDGDGQHDPADIKRLAQPIQAEGYEIVLGTRLKNRQLMPLGKRLANAIANTITYVFSGLWVSDSQSGFRAYSSHALQLINTRTDRYEFDSEVIREIASFALRYAEVPIETRYTAYSRQKTHKQSFVNGLITLYKLVWHIFG